VPKRTHKIKISDSKTRASGTLPRESDTTAGQLQVMLYKELFDAMIQTDDSDSTTSGSNVTMSFERVFNHLGLDPTVPFSEGFIKQSRPIVTGNMLQFDTGSARNLGDMVEVWRKYVAALGLGVDGKSEDQLELVYRRAGGRKKGKGRGKGGRKRKAVTAPSTVDVDDSEDRELQLAIEMSLQTSTGPEVAEAPSTSGLAVPPAVDEVVPSLNNPGDTSILVDDGPSSQNASSMESTVQVIEEEVLSLQTSNPTPAAAIEAEAYLHPSNPPPMTEEEREREEDAIALEVELSYRATGEIQDPGEIIPIRASQDPTPSNNVMDIDMGMIEESQFDPEDPKSGGIIGRHRFKYDSGLLKRHLEGVMSYWHGIRQPSGVDINNTRRCGWCEFEDGCEWR
jgi:exonuclease V